MNKVTPLLGFLRALDADQRKTFATDVATTTVYLYQLAGQPWPNPKLRLAKQIGRFRPRTDAGCSPVVPTRRSAMSKLELALVYLSIWSSASWFGHHHGFVAGTVAGGVATAVVPLAYAFLKAVYEIGTRRNP